MIKEELQKQLLTELNKNESNVIEKINRLLKNIPVKAKMLNLQIFPSQDGDGMFSIYAGVDGPDLYVLSKAIKEYADIFNPKHTANGIVPYIPTIYNSNVDYDVNDVIVDCTAKWLESVWEKINKTNLQIPVYITADEECCTFKQIKIY